MPGVEVQLINVGIGSVRKATTDGAGRYSVLDLEPGTYELRAAKPGFKAYVQVGLTLAVAATATIDFELVVGQVTQQILVTSELPLVDATGTGMSRVVGPQEI